MTGRKLQLLAVLLGLAVNACVHFKEPSPAVPNDQASQTLTLEVPTAKWEPVFFEALAVRTKQAGIPELRKTVLPNHDLEARFWYDHFEVIQGLIIRRSGEQWSASYLKQRVDSDPSSVRQETLGTPKSGWENAWNRLTSAGLLTLPDGSTTNCSSGGLDGIGYVVETNVDRKYRTYRYGNPQLATCDEAKRILSIESILADEFRLDSQK